MPTDKTKQEHFFKFFIQQFLLWYWNWYWGLQSCTTDEWRL